MSDEMEIRLKCLGANVRLIELSNLHCRMQARVGESLKEDGTEDG